MVLFAFSISIFNVPVQAQELASLPAPGTRAHLSPSVDPPVLKGIKVHPENSFQFDFILDEGQADLSQATLREESTKLIKYFLASITTPEKDLWVNLSPYEKDRIVPESFGQTEMGRDLLAQDYLLKQITASLIYPEDDIGRTFWKRIYAESAVKFGSTNIAVNTFNKVWIMPEKAVVYENTKNGTAYVVESKLQVMLESDYVAINKNIKIATSPKGTSSNQESKASQIIREIVIPALTQEINTGQNFAQLRQVYSSLILANWYKKKIKDSILSQVYADKNKVSGVNIDDPQEGQKIYERYLQAFKKGAYNYIKDEVDPVTQQSISRKYFSGGLTLNLAMLTTTTDGAMIEATSKGTIISAMVRGLPSDSINDPAMAAKSDPLDGPSQDALTMFDYIKTQEQTSSPVDFLNTLFTAPLLPRTYKYEFNSKDQMLAFVKKINGLWEGDGQEKSMRRRYGPILPLLAINVDTQFDTDQVRLRKMQQWYYALNSTAPLPQQALNLLLIIAGTVGHLRFLGMHPENKKLFDIGTLFGEGAFRGTLSEYLTVVKELKNAGALNNKKYIKIEGSHGGEKKSY